MSQIAFPGLEAVSEKKTKNKSDFFLFVLMEPLT